MKYHRRLLISAAILLGGWGVRIHWMAYKAIWIDEAFTVLLARLPLLQMFQGAARDLYPPIYYVLIGGWRLLFAESPFALRMFSTLFGIILLPLAYQIGRAAGDRRAGLAAMLITAVGWPLVAWSQEARMYTLLAALAGAILWATLRTLNDPSARWRWPLIAGFAGGLGLLTHYLFALALAVLNAGFAAGWLAGPRRWRLAARWAVGQTIAVLMYIPWHIYAWAQLRRDGPPPETVAALDSALFYLGVIFAGVTADLGRYLPLLILCGAVLVVCAAAAWTAAGQRQRRGWAVLVVCAFLPPLILFALYQPALNLPRPPLAARYVVMFAPPVYVLLGLGVTAFARVWQGWGGRVAGGVILAGMMALSGWALDRYYDGLDMRDDYASLAAALAALRQPEDVVILNNDTHWQVFDYHYPTGADGYITNTQPIARREDAEFWLAPLIDSAGGVWLAQNQFGAATDPVGYLRLALAERSLVVRRYDFPETELWFFALDAERASHARMDQAVHPPVTALADTPVGEGVRVTGLTIADLQASGGELASIGLGWHVDEGAQGDRHAAIMVVGADSEAIAIQPVTLGAGQAGDFYLPLRLHIPVDSPQGRARISLVVGSEITQLGEMVIVAGDRIPTAELPADAGDTHLLDVRFGDVIRLVAARLPNHETWPPGSAIPLTLYWQADTIVPERYKVFVHLIGDAVNPATGNDLWAQVDQEPDGGSAPTTRWLAGQVVSDRSVLNLPVDLPPGLYMIRVGLYPMLGGPRLAAVDSLGSTIGEYVVILSLRVEGEPPPPPIE